MTHIKIKRVYDDPEAEDGYRVLADRRWPRGMKKECLSYDEWAKEIRAYPVVTLLYASKDPVHNHARILQNYLEVRLKK